MTTYLSEHEWPQSEWAYEILESQQEMVGYSITATGLQLYNVLFRNISTPDFFNIRRVKGDKPEA